jgi:hypothetical protein
VSIPLAGREKDPTARRSSGQPSVSSDGCRIAYSSYASNLVSSGVKAGIENIYVFDRCAAGEPKTYLVTAGIAGSMTDAHSDAPHISGDSKCVMFASEAKTS